MSTDGNSPRIGVIGTGKMATALAKGWVQSGWITPANIVGTDVLPAAREQFAKKIGCETRESLTDVFAELDVILLAVKPQFMGDVLGGLKGQLSDRNLIVSIAAGISLATIAAGVAEDQRIVRVMPNTPALVGFGASGFALGENASDADANLVETMLSKVGIALQVPEHLLDAVTGLSGSGPAYVYQMIEALSDGGVRMGLPRHTATQLAAQTLLGAAQMVLETGEHPGVLKDAVTSPGGTTIAGLHALELGGLRGTLINAVLAATERSRELGKPS